MKTLLLLLVLLVSCVRSKTPMECGIEKGAQASCLTKLANYSRINYVQFATDVCEWKKEVYPCKLTQDDLDFYSDYECPEVKGCK